MPVVRIRIGGAVAAEIALGRRRFELTPAALLYAGEREKTRIVDRTLSGRDYRGDPFKPYSTKGPYYFYPQPAGGVGRRAAARRLFRKVSKRYGAELTRTGNGIRFPNYAAFKASLGRPWGRVDLLGPHGPHMLFAIVVRLRGNVIIIGVYGVEAERATGHNLGTARLPRRHFFDLGPDDRRLIAADLVAAALK